MDFEEVPEVLVVVDSYGTQYVIPKDRLQDWWDWLQEDYHLEYYPEWISRLAGVVYPGIKDQR